MSGIRPRREPVSPSQEAAIIEGYKWFRQAPGLVGEWDRAVARNLGLSERQVTNVRLGFMQREQAGRPEKSSRTS